MSGGYVPSEAEVEAAAIMLATRNEYESYRRGIWWGLHEEQRRILRESATAALVAAHAVAPGQRDPADFGGLSMPAMSEDERRLDQVWRAFGCATNPDAFKATVRERMWEQIIKWASETQTVAAPAPREDVAEQIAQAIEAESSRSSWRDPEVATDAYLDAASIARSFAAPSKAADR